jgi:hypothetical protein
VFVPSLNVTVPVGVPGDELVTAAVNVTDWPTCAGLSFDVTVVVVVSSCPVAVKPIVAETLAA